MVTLRHPDGLIADVATRGAALSALWVPDRDGHRSNVVLGHAAPPDQPPERTFFGSTIGRVTGRIADRAFALDGTRHVLDSLDGHTCHHGGPGGFDTLDWQLQHADTSSARLQLHSADGDQGFPGGLDVTAEYRLADAMTLEIDYTARCDRPTVVNLTHHAFWNLAGEGAATVADHLLEIPASRIAALDRLLLPTGALLEVTGSAFDFRRARELRAGLVDATDTQLRHAGGYDHYWVMDTPPAYSTGRRLMARLQDPASGRRLDVLSNQPGLQVYSGNFLDGRLRGASGRPYLRHSAICLEPQGFPDAANQPAFPAITLRPGETYRNRIAYQFHYDTPKPTGPC